MAAQAGVDLVVAVRSAEGRSTEAVQGDATPIKGIVHRNSSIANLQPTARPRLDISRVGCVFRVVARALVRPNGQHTRPGGAGFRTVVSHYCSPLAQDAGSP